MGGMGNQLFQYAAGLLQKETTNGTLLLCKPHTNVHDTQDYRDILFKNEKKHDGDIPPHVTLYQEDGYARWNPEEWKYPIVYLYGYFQHYPSIQSILPKFKKNILENLYTQRLNMKHKYKVFSWEKTYFMHVRRGDYLQNDTISHLHNLDYYKEAHKKLLSDKINYRLYLFSDDIEWCKSQDFFKSLDIIYVDEKDPINSLALMSEIKDGAIIANSTYSWMGAYLGCGLKKNSVIYPKKWNTDTNKSIDICPEEWIRI